MRLNLIFTICSFLFLLNISLIAGDSLSVSTFKFRVYLKDKSGNQYSLDKPEQFISRKAIDRRLRQKIEISENDLPVSRVYIDALSRMGFRVLTSSKWFNTVVIETADPKSTQKILSMPFVSKIQRVAMPPPLKKEVADASLDSIINLLLSGFRDDTLAEEKYQEVKARHGWANNQIEMLNGLGLHKRGYTGEGITIALLDAGFYKADEIDFFDSLMQSKRFLGSRDFVSGGKNVFDDDTHGMSVLSTMAANTPHRFIGTAPHASYWLIRTEDASSEYLIEEDNWVSGAEFADSVGADIINSSLGYTNFDDASTSHTYAEMNGKTAFITRGADIAASKGILVVNSAGNSGAETWNYIGAPADGESVLSVGAVDRFKKYAYFSSKGPTSDGRIKPNISALGQNIMVVKSDGSLESGDGTSFSSPVMAGMAACLWQTNLNATAMQVFKAIEQSGDMNSRPDQFVGFGIPDMHRASEILAHNVSVNTQKDSIVNLYTNPFINGITLEFFSIRDQQIKLSVKSNGGNSIATRTFKVNSNRINMIKWEKIKKLKEGDYTVEITTESGSIFRQIKKG